MLFNRVTKEHILQGIRDFEEKGYPNEFGPSSTYDLVHEGKHYAPKAIMAYANYHAEGRTIERYFKGGKNTDCFNTFEKLKFNVIKKQLKDPIFQIQVSNTDKTADGDFLTAKLQIVKGGYQLLKGSYIYKEPKPSFLKHSYYKMRVKYEKENYFEDSEFSKYLILKKSITFNKPSPAAVITLNRAANGKHEWKLQDGTTLEEFEKMMNLNDYRKQSSNTKLDGLIQNYKRALLEDNWLYAELYKFEWASWLYSKVDFNKQSNEEILEICLASQNENYTNSKGVQFIKQGAREKLSKYIGIEDIRIFRDFYNGLELEYIHYSSRNMSFPILSCWMSVLVPNSVFPASRTSFLGVIKELFSIKLKSSNIDFVIGMQKPMQRICNILLEDKEIVDFFSKQLHKSELSQLDLNWLTQDFLLFTDRNPNLLKSIAETTEEKKEQNVMVNIAPKNQILYGPPGTGKTFYLKDRLFDSYTLKKEAVTKEKYFEETVSNLTWWQVIALALNEIGKAKVNDILENRWVATKAALSESKNVRATLWGTLQMHTILESKNVAYKQRQNPLIFDKDDNKTWCLLDDEVKEQSPEIFDVLQDVNDFDISPQKVIKNYDFVTFHQSFAYEDFIEGIKPIIPESDNEIEDGQSLGYTIEDGVFKKLCIKAKNDPGNRYAIFIDEINRGNVSAIFGELITLIEKDKRSGGKNELSIKLPYSKKEFSVPANLDIYGTMNTADRSVEALDTALRRRFEFKEMMPDYGVIENEMVGDLKLSEVLKTINQRIELLIDRDHSIGHSYFVDVNNEEELAQAFNNKIMPLLQEYFYGDYGKIGLVLGKGFVEKLKNDKVDFAKFDYENANDYKIPSYQLKQVNALTVEDAVSLLLGLKEVVAE
ncbi:dynein-related subfamily AAA family protein [Algibacter lectus]|uniref:Dynein-related subfamily AAA family protein n=2 Tax=Algibacter lectus TaxID=221126 RepID=A0A4R8ME58_9FLAO|nr:dynein-related subfamily AAA family protein [Algibacter lectus]